jgi:hypothetical protein
MVAFFERRVNLYKKRVKCIRMQLFQQAIRFMHTAAYALAKGVQAHADELSTIQLRPDAIQ